MNYNIPSLAIKAMLYEVSATPKPGLVDRNNCGAHRDMDFFTFMSSAAALHSVFDEMFFIGARSSNFEIKSMWPELRKAGINAEKLMFSFTDNVNTHKGEIFSLGILCACAGWQLERVKKLDADTLMQLSKELCEGLCENDFGKISNKKELTKGEKIYLKYGYKGIRGEAESGYSTVKNISLPIFRELMEKKIYINDALVQTLLYLISETVDTNIISRHNLETAEYARNYAKKIISEGGIFTAKGRDLIYEMDRDFISKYISPGGCSDLLAVTYFLYSVNLA